MSTTSGRSRAHELDGLAPVGGLADDFDVVGRAQEHREAAAHEGLVVGDRDPDHSRRTVGNPRGDAEAAARSGPASSVPPYTATRSRMPSRPWPPSDRARVRRRGRRRRPRVEHAGLVRRCATRRVAGPACFNTLVSASCTIRYAVRSTPGGNVARSPSSCSSTFSPAPSSRRRVAADRRARARARRRRRRHRAARRAGGGSR